MKQKINKILKKYSTYYLGGLREKKPHGLGICSNLIKFVIKSNTFMHT